jgi:alpha-beta hydrolase superfamily lysophospholipase/SAM-dependent methyltransferase
MIVTESRTAAEQTFRSWDGEAIFYRSWPAKTASDRALILFHRGHEHGGRFQEMVNALKLEDINVFAWDARGCGRSPGERGWAPSFSCLVRDIDAFVRHVSKHHKIAPEDTIVLGYSVGSVTVATWVHDYAPPIRAMVLATPAFRVKLYIPFALSFLRMRNAMGGKAFIKSYVKSKMLTHDPEQARVYDADPLISRNIAVNIIVGLFDASRRVLEDARAISVPTLLLAAGSDWVVHVGDQRDFFNRLSSPVKRMKVFEGFSHAILHEKDRQQPFAEIRNFIQEAFSRPIAPSGESTAAARKPSILSRVGYGLARLGLQTLGRLSRGIRLGWKRGFDSGETLDYVYENSARGSLLVGRWIDRIYLNSPGWKGIRARKDILQELMEGVIRKRAVVRQPVRILDVASGPGRYLLELLHRMTDVKIEARLRDFSPQGVEAGRELARRLNLANATFETGDAFDADSLARLSPRADIAVVSGLFELFSDNDLIARSLRGLHAAIDEGGYLVYTNQPWHPQLEFIAGVLVNRDGKPWVMRCRSQAEMDRLVREAGFEKEDMRIDEQGIFSVSVARRRRP